MGTENACLLLYSLIKMTRPNVVLEIGAGDSSIHIVSALIDAKKEYKRDRDTVLSNKDSERLSILHPIYNSRDYDPKFISIDNFSAVGCSAEEAWKFINENYLTELKIELINDDFFDVCDNLIKENNSLDFIWLDAGTLVDDVMFIGKLWDKIAEGGILCIHEPYISCTIESKNGEDTELSMVVNPLWEKIIDSLSNSIEIISLPELHKYRQSGFGILRKKYSWEASRNSSFQEEMLAISEAPIRYSTTCINNIKISNAASRLSLLKSKKSRDILYAIGLGNDSYEKISNVTKLSQREVVEVVSRFIERNMVECVDGKLYENSRFWDEAATFSSKDTSLSVSQIESNDIITAIASHLEMDKKYSEKFINYYCSCFIDDYARLRRKLVDKKLLERDNECRTYTRKNNDK